MASVAIQKWISIWGLVLCIFFLADQTRNHVVDRADGYKCHPAKRPECTWPIVQSV